MAINPSTNTTMAGRVTAADPDYPYGSSKNESSPGAGDGTPYFKARADDLFGMQQALLRACGIVPSGNSETALASQYLQASVEIAAGRAVAYDDSGVADAYVLDLRANQQGPASYFDGLTANFIAANSNTGPCTVDVIGLGVRDIKLPGGYDPAALDIRGRTKIRYDSVNGWFELLKNVSPNLSQRYAPSLPTLGTSNKLIMVPATATGEMYVITKLANGKAGWIAAQIDKTVSPADAENTGGDSNYRAQQVYKLNRCFVAKTEYISKTAGTVLSALVPSQIDTMWGYSAGGGSDFLFSNTGALPFSWSSRELFNLSTTAEEIVYSVAFGEVAQIRFGMTNGSSSSVKIQTSVNGTDFVDYDIISLTQPPSGTITYKDYEVRLKQDATWYIKIINQAAASCYVAGLNIGLLPDFDDVEIDNALTVQAQDVDLIPSPYQGSGGANEFAAFPVGGKWFGTYHGGHSAFLERLRVNLFGSTASYDIRTVTPSALILTKFVQLHSSSTLTYGTSVYKYTASTVFGDGAYVCTYSLELISGNPVYCANLYTHMCTTQRNFNWVHLPKTINKEDDGVFPLGQCSFIQQYRATDSTNLNCYFSEVDCSENSFKGARIDFSTNYNKQYYGPAVNSVEGVPLIDGQWVTAKEYF